jgi:hypothetical protein
MNRITETILILFLTTVGVNLTADSVVTDSGTKNNVSVISIDKQNAVMSDKSKVPVKSIKSIEFDSFNVCSKPYGVILKDGSRISGLLVKKDKESIQFRSTTFGLIQIKKSSIAGYFYEVFSEKQLKDIPVTPAVVTKSGNIVEARKVLWADQKTAAIFSKKGMKKYKAEELSCVVVSAFPKSEKVKLRNGDVLNMNIDFSGKELKFKLDGNDKSVELKAVKKIKLK